MIASVATLNFAVLLIVAIVSYFRRFRAITTAAVKCLDEHSLAEGCSADNYSAPLVIQTTEGRKDLDNEK